MKTILIQLHRGYGLGDAVQMTAVLRHVAKHRPDWTVDYQADVGRHSAAVGLVRRAYSSDESVDETKYDAIIPVSLYDTFAAWTDRPNTRVSSCLHEKFGMMWDRECAEYEVNTTAESKYYARRFLASLSPDIKYRFAAEKFRVVCVHYEGDSSQAKKNLTHDQACEVCKHVEAMGMIPLLLDWRAKSPICSSGGIATVATLHEREVWGRDAQMNTAIIQQCEAFVGIDSGPGKCATASGTPTLICWTGHHPALFHDPSKTTTHLVPVDHAQIHPVNGNEAVLKFFRENYNIMTYTPGCKNDELVHGVKDWLQRTLK